MRGIFIVGDVLGAVETRHGVMAGMSEAAMPKRGGGGGEEGFSRW